MGVQEVPTTFLQVYSLIDSQVKLVITICGIEVEVDNTKSKKLLGMEYDRDLDLSLIQMVDSMLAQDIVRPEESSCVIY